MIYIYFTSGAFGTTIEYSIKRFTKEFESVNANILDDGSMHLYEKECHPIYTHELNLIDCSNFKIVTPVYPNLDRLPVKETINEFKKILTPADKVIFITHNNKSSVQRNELFVHHKIPQSMLSRLRDIDDIQKWNKNYKSSDDMQLWEKRELLSLLFTNIIDDIFSAKNYNNIDWLTITADNILFNFTETIKNIISYLELTFVDDELNEFADHWRKKQQYILDEYSVVENIVNSVIVEKEIFWGELNIVAEALIQHNLRVAGFDLQCYDLNTFPSNTSHLMSLLDRTA